MMLVSFDFQRGTVEVSIIPGWDAVLLGKLCPITQRHNATSQKN